MKFWGKKHRKLIDAVTQSWTGIEPLCQLARKLGINDIFQDNGAKVLQQLILLGFDVLPGREGHDAVSANGLEWEMKSINIGTGAAGFSTHHHLNRERLSAYRGIPWSFAIYDGETLQEIYVLSAAQMQTQCDLWEHRLNVTGRTHLNNPKIPVKFVRKVGTKIYPYSDPPIDPETVV